MTAEEALDSLKTFLDTVDATNVVVAARDPTSITRGNEATIFERLRMTEALSGEFLNSVLKVVGDGTNHYDLKPYDAGYKPDPHELCYVKLDDAPDIKAIAENLGEFDGLELFREDDNVVRNLRFYSVVCQGDDGQSAVFFRSCTPKIQLSRGRGIAVIHQGGYYNKVDSNVFLFDKTIDCFAWDGYLFIKSVPKFQKIFNYYAALMALADETLEAVEDRIPIKNFNEFQEMCEGNTLMLSKLAHIRQQPYFDDISMGALKETIREFRLDVQTEEDDGEEKLVFEKSPKKRWLILKLLGDSYLGSTMTNRKYEANSKTAV